MASTERATADPAGAVEHTRPVQEQTLASTSETEQIKPSSEAVEMTQLPTQPQVSTNAAEAGAEAETVGSSPSEPPTETVKTQTPSQPTIPEPLHTSEPSRPTAGRSETAEFALGPEGAALPAQSTDSSEAVLRITLMLTNGARHPYLISSKYLAARKVEAVDAQGSFDPREMSAYKLKELIWTDWRPEWEPKPRDPAAIRLIILGRMLDDKSQLKESPFSLLEPNVVHMTVKPADLFDDDAEGAGKGISKSLRGRSIDDGESAGCCKCVVQ